MFFRWKFYEWAGRSHQKPWRSSHCPVTRRHGTSSCLKRNSWRKCLTEADSSKKRGVASANERATQSSRRLPADRNEGFGIFMQLKQIAQRQVRLVRGMLIEKNWWTKPTLNVEKIIGINPLLEGHA